MESNHRLGVWPARRYLRRRIGNLTQINEYFGFPDMTNWEAEDYVHHGANIVLANGPGSITRLSDIMNVLSTRKLSCHSSTISAYLDNWPTYTRMVSKEAANLESQRAIRRKIVEQHFIEVPYPLKGMSFDETVQEKTWAKYQLAQNCLGQKSIAELCQLSLLPPAELHDAILRHNPDLTEIDIEMEAVMLHVSDLLWASDNVTQSLFVPAQELEDYRAKRRIQQK